MMSTAPEFVTKFNKLSNRQVLSVKDMTPIDDYLITAAERTTTKYGDGILLELGANILYLPRRFNILSDKDVEALASGLYVLSKMPFNNDQNSTAWGLEIKEAPTLREYYTFNECRNFK